MFCSDGEGLEDNEFRKNDKNLNKATTAERERERGERGGNGFSRGMVDICECLNVTGEVYRVVYRWYIGWLPDSG